MTAAAHACEERVEDGAAREHVGEAAVDEAVEAAGSKQRGVDEVGPVGRRYDADANKPLDAVQLRQQLVDHALRDTGRVAAAAALRVAWEPVAVSSR